MPAIWIPKRLVETSLINAAAKDAQSFVTHCEIEYEYRVVAAAAEISKGGYKVCMVTGPSSSGKTTTAHKLANALCELGHKSKVISLDDFYLDLKDYPRLPDGSKDYENVTALDVPEIKKCLDEIIKTGKTDLPQFDFKNEARKAERKAIDVSDGLVIVEGIHALNPILIDSLQQDKIYKIYAGMREEYSHKGQRTLPTRDIRLVRRMVRDAKFRGHSLEKTMSMWPAVCDGEDLYIKIFKQQADLLLDTSFSYEICVLAQFLPELRTQLPRDSVYCERMEQLAKAFSSCDSIDVDMIPQASMLREFVG